MYNSNEIIDKIFSRGDNDCFDDVTDYATDFFLEVIMNVCSRLDIDMTDDCFDVWYSNYDVSEIVSMANHGKYLNDICKKIASDYLTHVEDKIKKFKSGDIYVSFDDVVEYTQTSF